MRSYIEQQACHWWCDKDYRDLEDTASEYTSKMYRRKNNLHSVAQDFSYAGIGCPLSSSERTSTVLPYVASKQYGSLILAVSS